MMLSGRQDIVDDLARLRHEFTAAKNKWHQTSYTDHLAVPTVPSQEATSSRLGGPLHETDVAPGEGSREVTRRSVQAIGSRLEICCRVDSVGEGHRVPLGTAAGCQMPLANHRQPDTPRDDYAEILGPYFGHEMDVVMGFSPVIAHE